MSAATLEAPEPRMQWRSQATERLGTITLETAGNSGRPLTDIYSRDEIMALWRHCSNGNASFVTACNFSKNGEPVFYYRERRIPLYQRLNSSYRSASGRTSKPEQWNAVCVYTQNDDGKTVIGAGDFDAHGKPDAPATAADWERAQAYALSSLRQSLLLEEEFALPRGFLFRILEHTGGGFRLTLITKEYVERQRMAEMLRFIAKGMEVELAGSEHPFSIGSGVAEFMPDWATSGEEYGKPTKLPGSFNPKRGVQSLTLYEDLKPLIGETMAREQQIRQAAERSPEIKKQYVLLPSNISSQGTTEECQRRQAEASLEKMKAKMLADYPAERGRRNEAVKKLVGAAFERMNERHILDLVRRQYDAATGLEDSAKRHEQDGAAMIATCQRRWLNRLTPEEAEHYRELKTDAERNCFRILRGWAALATKNGEITARLASSQMAARIDVDRSTVDAMRDRFHGKGIIAASRSGGRNFFRWMPALEQPADMHSGDPF